MTETPHEIITAAELAVPSGYAHAVSAAAGRAVYLSGQTAQRADGAISGDGIVQQFDVAAANVVSALRAAGAQPGHLVSMLILTTDVRAYRAASRELGRVWRAHFGKHYPALSVAGVSELYDPDAMVELIGVAVIP